MKQRLAWVTAYAVAMAFVEAAVVVYLRVLGPATGPLAALQTVLPSRIVAIEIGREAATLVMLLAVAVLAGQGVWQRFLFFALAFGIWDIGYYAWLRVLVGWPESLLTWDVLFLIPVPWIAPVLAPLVVSAGLVGGSLWWLVRRGGVAPARYGLPTSGWLLSGGAVALVLLAFTLDWHDVLVRGEPPAFRWGLFWTGVALGAVAQIAAARSQRS